VRRSLSSIDKRGAFFCEIYCAFLALCVIGVMLFNAVSSDSYLEYLLSMAVVWTILLVTMPIILFHAGMRCYDLLQNTANAVQTCIAGFGSGMIFFFALIISVDGFIIAPMFDIKSSDYLAVVFKGVENSMFPSDPDGLGTHFLRLLIWTIAPALGTLLMVIASTAGEVSESPTPPGSDVKGLVDSKSGVEVFKDKSGHTWFRNPPLSGQWERVR